MKKQMNLHWSRFLPLAILTAMTVMISSFVYVSAENHNSASVDDFKVGDKVEVSTGGLVGDLNYEPCVITEVRTNGYMVQCVYGNRIYFVQKAWVRGAKKAEPVKEPEPIIVPEPVKKPEPINVPEPITDPEKAKAPEPVQNEMTDEQLFENYDGNKSGWLSGRELGACQCIEFDTNGDNEVTRAEFMAGMRKKKGNPPVIEAPKIDQNDDQQMPRLLGKPGDGAQINGAWKGTYTCAQGLTNLVLSLYTQDGTNVDGIFTFLLGDGAKMTVLGSFKMKGTYDGTKGWIDLKGVDWDQKPAGYLIGDLSGSVTQTGLGISGNVTKPTGCTTFKVERITF